MLLVPWVPTRLARLGFFVAAIAILILALMPAKEVPITTSWDKLDHWVAFFTLSGLAEHAWPKRRFWLRIAPCLVGFGIFIEFAQYFTPDRDADAMDVVADSIGIIGYGVVRLLARFVPQPVRAEPS